MKALLQRVSSARVDIAEVTVGQIGHGLLVLLCAESGDTEAVADKLLAKTLKLRVFSHDGTRAEPPQVHPAASADSALHAEASVGTGFAEKMNLSVQDVKGGLLIVSQFTLAADVSGGNRPSFSGSAAPDKARRLYDYFVAQARLLHPVVHTGQFAADMHAHMVNDGPVTISLQVPALAHR